MTGAHRYIIGKIYLVTGLSLLLLTACFYQFGFKPLSDRLRAEYAQQIDYSLDSKLWLVQGVLDKLRDLSTQSASRTAIRDKQVAYLLGEVSLADLVSFSAPKLADAMHASADIVGISRFDPQGNLLFSVGAPLPEGVAGRCGLAQLNTIRMLEAMRVGKSRQLFFCSPILDPVAGYVGTDILAMKDDRIQHFIDTRGSIDSQEMVISLASDNRILYWPGKQPDSPMRKVLEKFFETGFTESGYIIRSKEVHQTGWHIYATIDQTLFFADINHQLRTLLGVVFGVATLLFALTFAVLRPIIRTLLKEQQLLELSSHDGLTGLYNHAHMRERLDQELARAKRYGRPLSILMLDIDHFKAVNDNYGHQAGDEVLRKLACQLQGTARTQDIAARYGGEEFMLILPEIDEAGASSVAERLRGEVASMKPLAEDRDFMVTISIGVVTYDTGAGEAAQHDIIDTADKALYASKNGGRNRVTIGYLSEQTPDSRSG